MGTIDLDDDALEDSLMRSLASRPDPSAVFRGTIDDGDLNIFTTFDDIDAKAASAKAAISKGAAKGPTPPRMGAATPTSRSSTTPPSSPSCRTSRPCVRRRCASTRS